MAEFVGYRRHKSEWVFELRGFYSDQALLFSVPILVIFILLFARSFFLLKFYLAVIYHCCAVAAKSTNTFWQAGDAQ